jgi:UDP-N-acetylmuramyl pentapeptide phosphotransferase/UDP-N-acetylglucosamine-1-phosphate transferase
MAGPDPVWPLFVWPAVALSLTAALLHWMLRRLPGWLAFDRPNPRSLHERPVPRVGGLAILVGATLPLMLSGEIPWVLWLPAAGLAALSWVDDRRDLPVGMRLVGQLVAAALFLIGVEQDLSLTWLLALPFVVWMTNLYNFMDGADGLAGGMTLFGFVFLGLAAAHSGFQGLALSAFVPAAAAAGFLFYNFAPARIFMGDVGSIPLGFLAAGLGYLGWRQDVWPLWFPLLVFSPFIVDASVTLLRRLLRGDRVWQAHRSHYYQRLVRMGWGHRRTALAEYGLMVLCGISALLGLEVVHPGILGAFWIGGYSVTLLAIDRAWRIRRHSSS